MKKPVLKKLNHDGFTFMELVVVLAIMTILMGILMPRLINYVRNGNEVQRQKQEELADKAVRQYFAYEGSYPDLADMDGSSGNVTLSAAQEQELSTLVREVTGTRLNITDYRYTYNENTGNVSLEII